MGPAAYHLHRGLRYPRPDPRTAGGSGNGFVTGIHGVCRLGPHSRASSSWGDVSGERGQQREREKAEQAGRRDNLDAKPLSTLPAKAKPSEPTAAPIRPGTHRKLICRSSALLEQAVQFLGGLLPKPGRGQSRTQACKTCMHPGRPREGTRARARACQGGPKGGKGGVQVP